jgi:hypothetical protein
MSSMRSTIRNFPLLLMLILVSGIATPGFAQTSEGPLVFETGHSVTGLFMEQYNSVSDPLEIYGLPITGEFQGMSAHGITTVQYFTKARFDLLIGADGKQSIVVANLGELLYPGPGPLAPVPNDGPTCQRFPDTGKNVCYAFLQYYQSKGGKEVFGEPISDLEIREGRYVQYFEKVRMEWQPELQADVHVVLTDLGKRYFDLVVGDNGLIKPSGSAIPGKPRQPRALAFVSQSLVPANSQQKVYVIVMDMFDRPVADAQVWVYVRTPDGQLDPYRAPDTNSDGISILPYPVGNLNPHQVVELEVKVTTGGEEAETQTWFRVWY